jgi:hypothetical protein
MATVTPPKPTCPRPLFQYEDLFREPVYVDGQPYAADEEEDEDK